MPKYILSVIEQARVQYEVFAVNESDARDFYARGQVTTMLIDEHDGGEIVDVTEVGK